MHTATRASFFITENFLLRTELARQLYHDYARVMPIIDYHCHLPSTEIAEDKVFENMTQVWLYGDHYKWRAMRTLGIDEYFITGGASDDEKFMKWAQAVPFTMRNPLYHWSHMELLKPFGIKECLSGNNAAKIYRDCSEQLRTVYSTQKLIEYFNVETICTTDGPLDTLDAHKHLASSGFNCRVLPAFRPDKAMEIENLQAFQQFVRSLGEITNTTIHSYDAYLDALKSRHRFFHEMGCRLSDHGLETLYAVDFTGHDIQRIFSTAISAKQQSLSPLEIEQFKSALLIQFAEWDWERGWTQQFHLGSLRGNNERMMAIIGPESGFDSIGDFPQAASMAKFFNRLDRDGKLAQTIIYNLNPADNEVFATMIGNFNDGSVRGKIQWGAAWWFLDQKDGMEKQLNTLSNMGLITQFVGMLTDSRSFLSYSRHEYFRRILCNLFAEDVANNELPNDPKWIGKLIQDICYNNAKQYFQF